MNTGVAGDPEKYTRDRKKKKMKLQMDGPFPLLPNAPPEHSESAGVMQLMIREFVTLHYQLACGKETTTPWNSMGKHQSKLWDDDMWPSDVMVKDPSKITLPDCRKIIGLWRQRQAQSGASETFRFNFYIDSEGLQPSIYSITTPPTRLFLLRPSEPLYTMGELNMPAATPPPSTRGISVPTATSPPIVQDMPSPTATPPLTITEMTLPTAIPPLSIQEIRLPTARTQLPDQNLVFHNDPVRQPDLPPEHPHSHSSAPDIESDPPIAKQKKKQLAAVYSDQEGSSDPSTDNPEARAQRRRALISHLSLAPASPHQSDEDAEILPPRYNKKGKKQVTNKRNLRKKAPAAAVIHSEVAAGAPPAIPSIVASRSSNQTDHAHTFRAILPSQSPVNDSVLNSGTHEDGLIGRDQGISELPVSDSGDINALERIKIKPKPKPRKKQTNLADGSTVVTETAAEQREREDNLFIVRKSGRTHKPKYNVAPPAQLHLEKEREANKRKGNHL